MKKILLLLVTLALGAPAAFAQLNPSYTLNGNDIVDGALFGNSGQQLLNANAVMAGLNDSNLTLDGNRVNTAALTFSGYRLSLGGNLTTGGALAFSGAYSLTATLTGNTSITLPASGTLLSTADIGVSVLPSSWTGSTNLTTLGPISSFTAATSTNLTLNAGSGNQNVVVAPTGTGAIYLQTNNTLNVGNSWQGFLVIGNTSATGNALGLGFNGTAAFVLALGPLSAWKEMDFGANNYNWYQATTPGAATPAMALNGNGLNITKNLTMNGVTGNSFASFNASKNLTATAASNNTLFAWESGGPVAQAFVPATVTTDFTIWTGSTSITQVGTVTTGIWSAGKLIANLAAVGSNTSGTAFEMLHSENPTAAANGAQQYSGLWYLGGQGWKTASTAASQAAGFTFQAQPIQGSANPTVALVITPVVNGSAGNPLTFNGGNSTLSLDASTYGRSVSLGFGGGLNLNNGTITNSGGTITGNSGNVGITSGNIQLNGNVTVSGKALTLAGNFTTAGASNITLTSTGTTTVTLPTSGTLATTSQIPDTSGLAPKNSPALTGTPTAPTQATATDSSTQIATDEFVQAAIAAAGGGGGGGGNNVSFGTDTSSPAVTIDNSGSSQPAMDVILSDDTNGQIHIQGDLYNADYGDQGFNAGGSGFNVAVGFDGIQFNDNPTWQFLGVDGDNYAHVLIGGTEWKFQLVTP